MRRAAEAWAATLAEADPTIAAVGYFGSYARGDAGVGSDLDLIVLVRESAVPFERRATAWPLEALPVPADLLVYTIAEWQRLMEGETRFARTLRGETRWLTGTPPA